MAVPRPRLVVIDDEPGMLALVERIARPEGFEVDLHASARQALAQFAQRPADAALVDLRMPELGGLEVLQAIRAAQPECQVILMTAHATIDSAIDAVKRGALDYLSKPLDIGRLRQLLGHLRDSQARRVALLEAENVTALRLGLCGMIGRSAVMQQLFDLIRRVAPHLRTALVTGETGAGKEGVARALHQLGPRRGGRFVTINCSAVVETLFESELFGHVRGAFTGASEHKAGLFEAADGGTLFLDEIGELPPALQAKLLRVLETGEVQRVGSLQAKKVDVRVIAATNRDLTVESSGGRFRPDLYYRLNAVELTVPPLRVRPGDIPYLTAAFVSEFAGRFDRPLEGVSPGAERILVSAMWPGNVRELRNVLERACMLAEGRVLTERDLQPSRASSVAPVLVNTGTAPSFPSLQTELRQAELEQIRLALRETGGNKRKAGARLGLSARTFYRRLHEHGLMSSTSRS